MSTPDPLTGYIGQIRLGERTSLHNASFAAEEGLWAIQQLAALTDDDRTAIVRAHDIVSRLHHTITTEILAEDRDGTLAKNPGDYLRR